MEPAVESGLLLFNCVPVGEPRSSCQSKSLPGHLRQLLTEGSARQSPGEDPVGDPQPPLQQCLTKAPIPGQGPGQGKRPHLGMSYVHIEIHFF